jgi:hypothetical protein
MGKMRFIERIRPRQSNSCDAGRWRHAKYSATGIGCW